MDFIQFIYNVLIMALYISNCVCFFVLYKKLRDKSQLWIALMFLLFCLDNFNLYMIEFLPKYLEFYKAELFFIKHLESIVNGLIVFSYYMILQSYQKFKTKLEVLFFWGLVTAVRITISETPFDFEYKQALNLFTFVVDIWVFAYAVTVANRQRKGIIPKPEKRFGVPVFSFPFFVISLVLYCGVKIEKTVYMYGAGTLIEGRFLFIEIFGAFVSILAMYFMITKILPGTYRIQPQSAPKLIANTGETVDEFFTVYGISKREKEVGALILNGLSNAEISKKLYISEGTVKMHVHKILLKLDINSRAKLNSKLNEHIEKNKLV